MKEEKNIQDELNELSPFLAKLRKPDNGFDVPQNYFQNFESNLMARIKAEEEVEKWSPSSTISAESSTSPSRISKVLNWLKTPQISISFAMILVIIVAINVLLQPIKSDEILVDSTLIDVEKAISNVSTEEMLAYVEENVEQFDETLLSEVVEVELKDNVEIEETTEIETPILETIETEELEQYLEENIGDFDENLIEEEILEFEDLEDY